MYYIYSFYIDPPYGVAPRVIYVLHTIYVCQSYHYHMYVSLHLVWKYIHPVYVVKTLMYVCS